MQFYVNYLFSIPYGHINLDPVWKILVKINI